MIPCPPISTLFPYTTLFRSLGSVNGPPGPSFSSDQRPAVVRPAPARAGRALVAAERSEEHTSELQSRPHLVCRLLLEKKKRFHIPKMTSIVTNELIVL